MFGILPTAEREGYIYILKKEVGVPGGYPDIV
jgi:hypothetical protein